MWKFFLLALIGLPVLLILSVEFDNFMIFVLGLIGFVIAFFVFIALGSARCSKCKKIGLQLIKKEEIDRYNSKKNVTEKVRNKKGEVVRTIEKTIPVTKVVYSCTYKCKHCGNIETSKHEEEK